MSEERSRLYRELLERSTVPDYLMSGNGEFEPQPLSERAVAYEDLMALLRRVEEQPWGWEPDVVHPDVFEEARRDGETRRQAKTRIMLEAYNLEGRQIRDADLWALRAQYVRIQEYVQGSGGGRPYSTHDWVHFYSRYGSGGGREASLMIGLRRDTVEEMGRRSMIESQSLWAMRLLGH